MKKTLARLEPFRIKTGPLASTKAAGRNGAFDLPGKIIGRPAVRMRLIISDAAHWDRETLGPIRWEHVSASFPDRCPTWAEMCRVKDICFDEHEAVIQFHPPKRVYVNFHPYCLHLWKPIDARFPIPPPMCVGPKDSPLAPLEW